MFSIFQINLRRIATVFLISITLFLGLAFNIGNNLALADAITRDVTNVEEQNAISEPEYESAKMNRQQKQAMRSQQATPNQNNETVKEKLNLDEIEETLDLDEILPDLGKDKTNKTRS